MRLGFIGVGNISSDVIYGIFNSKISIKKIILSPRNKKKSNQLKKKFKKIDIAKNNQEVIDKSDWVFLGILPSVGEKILPKLNFKKKQLIISFISTINHKRLKKLTKNNNIVRAIPMPPISLSKGPIALFPTNMKAKNFFNKIGVSIEINNESLSKNFWTISGTMALFYETLKVLSDYMVKNKLKRSIAQKYVTSLYSALALLAVENSKKDLKNLVSASQTPGGLNWQGVNELRKSGYFKLLQKTLKRINKRL